MSKKDSYTNDFKISLKSIVKLLKNTLYDLHKNVKIYFYVFMEYRKKSLRNLRGFLISLAFRLNYNIKILSCMSK